MRTISILFLSLLASFSLKAQDITGQWNGVLQVQGIEIRLVFHVDKTEKGYSSTLDSPDQGTNDIPITITTFEDSKIKFEITAAKIEYTGELIDNEFIGTYKQGVHEIPLNLSRTANEKAEKPQEPKKPYPYYTEEVTFQNPKAKITLAGTLSLPKKEGKFPVV
ncbi:MAG: alpha/beta hydrolase, partial [Crocinitomicaceae bacterium]